MKKNPSLTLIPTESTSLQPPATLGSAGAKLWKSITREYRVDDAGSNEMLLQICAAADRVEEYGATIARDGLTIRTKNGVRDHPLLKHELAARAFISRALHRLNLDIEPTRGR